MKNKNFPSCVIPIKNKDKEFHQPIDMEDLANMAHPSRIILCGNPNSGKSLAILNMLLHKKPPFQKIYLIHNDPTPRSTTPSTVRSLKNCQRLMRLILTSIILSSLRILSTAP